MNEASKLLDIVSPLTYTLSPQTNRVVAGQLDKAIHQRIARLNELAEEIEEKAVLNVPQYYVSEIFSQVIVDARLKEAHPGKWNSRELLTMAFHLPYIFNDRRAFRYTLSLLSSHWRDSFINGIVFTLQNNWLALRPEISDDLRRFILGRTENYRGANKRCQQLRDNYSLIEEAGPLRMAMLIMQNGIPVTDAPSLLGFRQTTFALPFYSDVILKYVEKAHVVDTGKVRAILAAHKLDRTRKLIMAYLVEQADMKESDARQKEITMFVQEILGDISLAATWSPFKGATKGDIARLRNAKTIVNRWYTKKVIKVFFEKCVDDERRKRFWLKYTDHIVDFRIVGHWTVRGMLLRQKSIADVVPQHFVSCQYKQTTALVLCIKDKVFVEFSDNGALSVYKHGSSKVAIFDDGAKSIFKTDGLKRFSPQLVDTDIWGEYNVYNDGGKMNHMGNWENRLENWLVRKVFSSDAPSIPFSSDDEEVFKEEPAAEYVEYVDGIRYGIYSKYLPGDYPCRIVANDMGFYVYFKNSMRYAFVRKMHKGENANGALTLKQEEDGWYVVRHIYKKAGSTSATEDVVCYLKEDGRSVMCKTTKSAELTTTYTA